MNFLADLLQKCKCRKFDGSETVFRAGDEGEDMYIILQGQVVVLRPDKCGNNDFVCFLGPGDFVGEMSMLEKLPRTATIKTMEPTVMLELNEANFSEIISGHPDLAFHILRGLSRRLREIYEKS